MTDQELDNLMCRVLGDAIKLDCEYDNEQDIFFEASNHHQSQIRAMLKDPLCWAKKRSWPLWEKVLRRVAVAVLTITIGFGSVMAVSPTVRAAVIRWVMEWYDTYIVYRYFGEALDGGMPHYDITGLGEDYVEAERIVNDQAVSVLYENETGDKVCFDYNYLQNTGIGIFASNDNDVKEVKINCSEGLLFIPHDSKAVLTVTWIDERSNMHFSISANLDEKEIIRIAESIEKNK